MHVSHSGRHEAEEAEESPMKRTGGTAAAVRLGIEVLLVAAVVFLCLYSFTGLFREPEYVAVTYYTPQGTFSEENISAGSRIELAQGPEIEGYTFIGWRNEDGNIETQTSLKVFEDTAFSAVYSFALETGEHVPYMLLDKGAYFRPNDLFTRGEAAIMIYRLLNTDKVGTESFTDVRETDSCYTACATLKELGVIGGSRFHPEDPITRGELLEMLSAFCPASSNRYVFADLDESDGFYPAFCAAADRGWIRTGDNENADPDAEMTRLEAAVFMNSILGRAGDSGDDHSLSGTFFDISFDNEHFWDAAEATLAHEYKLENGREKWTSSEGLELHEPGIFFIGVKLYYAGEDGGVVTDKEIDGLYFGPDGCYSSGNPNLDVVVWSILSEIIDPETMEREEMLRICYDYCVKSFKYKARELYDFGETGWQEKVALEMLTLKKGNCYYFAGAFWAMARALGYDAHAYSGTVSKRSHGWVEIEFEDGPHIFDPELQFIRQNSKKIDMFNKPLDEVKGWGYRRPEA